MHSCDGEPGGAVSTINRCQVRVGTLCWNGDTRSEDLYQTTRVMTTVIRSLISSSRVLHQAIMSA
jgi:hypothetical protein